METHHEYSENWNIDQNQYNKNYLETKEILESIKNTYPEVVKKFPMRSTPYYLSLINWDDEADPIAKMVIPSQDELNYKDIGTITHEHDNTKLFGLQHKYDQTALILVSNECASYCRYCFRKRFVGLHQKEIMHNFEKAVEYIKDHPEINNVLLSGGDPLILSNQNIKRILELLDELPQLKFIRIGSKVPVTFPSRITNDPELLDILKDYSKPNRRIHLQTHFNHPKEITKESISAIDALISANVLIQNQSVLLRGVNDDPKILAELLNSLVGIGVNPYYVFQCRPFTYKPSAFQVPLWEGIDIINEARKYLNGQSKRFKFCMSHATGKIEIIGKMGDEILFKYHQSKYPENHNKIFTRKLPKDEVWLWEHT
ncbi:MAG: KamA family radical SAM protein [Candidatus Lokiarchaeota archaeon]|nr:KamA family radical SAM protein [Candidatus Harpocratesius repetitus]